MGVPRLQKPGNSSKQWTCSVDFSAYLLPGFGFDSAFQTFFEKLQKVFDTVFTVKSSVRVKKLDIHKMTASYKTIRMPVCISAIRKTC